LVGFDRSREKNIDRKLSLYNMLVDNYSTSGSDK